MSERTVKVSSVERFSLKQAIIVGGAIIGLLIGSGFATGQEILQYFVSYGFWGIAGGILCLILLAFVGASFLVVGNHERFAKGTEVYTYYCGSILGKFYDVFSNIFVFMSYFIMIAGAGATGQQQFGWPIWLGAVGMMILTMGSVLLGLKRFNDIIGSIMPVVVILCIVMAVFILIRPGGQMVQNDQLVKTMVANGQLKQVGSHWFEAALNYVGFCMLWMAAFLAETGKTNNSKKEAMAGGLFGSIAFTTAVILLSLALLSRAHEIGSSAIPSLVLANSIHPIFGFFYSLIMFIGIYSTAVPLLWNPCARIADEGTSKFKLAVLILGVAGGLIGLFVNFKDLINLVYGINGYAGVLLLVLMVIHFIRYKGFVKK